MTGKAVMRLFSGHVPRRLCGFTLAVVLLAGCGGAPSAPAVAAALAGSEWVLVSLHGEGLIEGTRINLVFDAGHLGGSMTCNGYGGGPDSGKFAAKDDGTLTIPHEVAVTLQFCSEPEGIMEQEAAYIEALRDAATYRVVDDRLEIAGPTGQTTLVFARK